MLQNEEAVLKLQDQSQMSLCKYLEMTKQSQTLRLGRMLLLLPSLSFIAPDTISKIFFQSSAGPIQVERIISDLFKTDVSSKYALQLE